MSSAPQSFAHQPIRGKVTEYSTTYQWIAKYCTADYIIEHHNWITKYSTNGVEDLFRNYYYYYYWEDKDSFEENQYSRQVKEMNYEIIIDYLLALEGLFKGPNEMERYNHRTSH